MSQKVLIKVGDCTFMQAPRIMQELREIFVLFISLTSITSYWLLCTFRLWIKLESRCVLFDDVFTPGMIWNLHAINIGNQSVNFRWVLRYSKVLCESFRRYNVVSKFCLCKSKISHWCISDINTDSIQISRSLYKAASIAFFAPLCNSLIWNV